MREFFVVLKFEFLNFFKNKAFIISTAILAAMIIIGLSFPTIKNAFFGVEKTKEGTAIEEQEDLGTFGYIDSTDGKIDINTLKQNFPAGKLKEFTSKEDLESEVNKGNIEAGFILEDTLKYKNIIKNNEMMGSGEGMFEDAIIETYRIKEFENLGINYNEVQGLIRPEIQSETVVLGKDSANNFLYTNILVFGLYFVILMYGQLIASGVASEKSNRAMEVLVTSTDSKNLIFGKVIAGALAGFAQFFTIIALGMITYQLNREAWDNSLDFLFKIPADILLNFALFGILGYLFYAFIYGALGALVSRTEDISASATPITIIFIGVFFIAMTGMQNTEGILLKVASFVPFSSFMAMFVRVSMGSVKLWEVILSLGILFISTILIGILASKIYRMGTLRYGNPVKLKDALKSLKED
ncbi:ABC transporter permease [Tissierella creatinophila]|uniref:ABC-2 family transporter protein n=1 Tax=Tissierella creatinophila DSM 6911 TaxID=1123403 RepID=A0A1U7M2K4_TISCR|nr:ABC transporter permease [Tissierella creatinophila]OLS01521.1 ABC-2 family transporter protein [Tissierella creatinophila DSM 6911]